MDDATPGPCRAASRVRPVDNGPLGVSCQSIDVDVARPLSPVGLGSKLGDAAQGGALALAHGDLEVLPGGGRAGALASARRAEKALRSRGIAITDIGGGQHRIKGILTDEAAALINAAVDPLAAPRPAVKGPDGEPASDSRPTLTHRQPLTANPANRTAAPDRPCAAGWSTWCPHRCHPRPEGAQSFPHYGRITTSTYCCGITSVSSPEMFAPVIIARKSASSAGAPSAPTNSKALTVGPK